MTSAQLSIAQQRLQRVRQREQAERIGNRGPAFSQAIGQELLRQAVLVDELAVARSFLDRVEIFALQVFEQR